ncbi:MAG: hypothetical protein ABGW82_11235 [Paracoccus sp. (in: a-proteobacteria)]
MDEPTDLTKAQRQRADALVIAGRILGKRPSPFGASGFPEARPTEDLADLAQFILHGEHPLAAYREASLSPVITGTLNSPRGTMSQDRLEALFGNRDRAMAEHPSSTPVDGPGDDQDRG